MSDQVKYHTSHNSPKDSVIKKKVKYVFHFKEYQEDPDKIYFYPKSRYIPEVAISPLVKIEDLVEMMEDVFTEIIHINL